MLFLDVGVGEFMQGFHGKMGCHLPSGLEFKEGVN